MNFFKIRGKSLFDLHIMLERLGLTYDLDEKKVILQHRIRDFLNSKEDAELSELILAYYG